MRRQADREQEGAPGLNIQEAGMSGREQKGAITMPEPAEDAIVRNLIESLERLHEDLDRMELWAAALGSFTHPIPTYQPDRHLLNPSPNRPLRRAGF
jgi:hypothetical protein